MRNSFLAFVLLERPAAPDMAALATALRTRHPELATEMHASDRVSARARRVRLSSAVAINSLR